MHLDQFLVITRNKEFGNIAFMGPMTGAELEAAGEHFEATFETFGIIRFNNNQRCALRSFGRVRFCDHKD